MADQHNTFVKFTAEQAAEYASGRGHSYPLGLYEAIFDYHEGERKVLLDIGTGPGKVVFDLLPRFEQAIGSDAGVHMIEQARKDAEKRGVSDKTQFVVCRGEECEKALAETGHQSVDVITVATAAHWLNIGEFYEAAAKALRPGGTLAMWTGSRIFPHPSEPNAKAIQEAINYFDHDLLGAYHTAGNALTRDGYEGLALPWTLPSPNSGFQKSDFVRRDWDRHGIPSAPNNPDGSPGPFLSGNQAIPLEAISKALNSASSVIRWREAHPDKALGSEDPVIWTMKKIKELSGGKESLIMSPGFSLLLLRNAAQ